MKKLFTSSLLLITAYCVLITAPMAYAAVCGEAVPQDEGSLRDYIADCQSQIQESKGVQATLSSAISYLNNQISLAQAQIANTQVELDKLNSEIINLSDKIESIDYSLDDLTILFITRVQSDYKERNTNDVVLSLFNNSGFFDFFRHYQYIQKIRDHDREVLITLESARLDFDQQKSLKEVKQEEVVALKINLSQQQTVLNGQVATKNKFLADTKNDEKKYQSLLSQANTQLQKFQNFVASRGGASILSNQTVCNEGWSGCYYNQRDALWGNLYLGTTSYQMKNSGCFATSVAMLASHNGKNIKPGDIATSSDTITPGGDVIHSFNINGVNVSITKTSTSSLDSYLNSGRPVMAELNGGVHFIVILRKEGDTYIMNDPFTENGYNKPLNVGGYSASNITSLRIVNFN